MKICTKCKVSKDELEFVKKHTSKDGLNSRCKICTRDASKAAYYKNTTYYLEKNQKRRRDMAVIIQEKKNKPCKDCGNAYPPYCMDFDHLRDKTFNISAEMHRHGLQQLFKEIEKCDVVCAVCHRIRTHFRKHSRVA